VLLADSATTRSRTPVFGYQTRCRDAYSVEALIAERSRPADGNRAPTRLTCYRRHLTQARAAEKSRVEKLLETRT
jgi:hypothetical protein